MKEVTQDETFKYVRDNFDFVPLKVNLDSC